MIPGEISTADAPDHTLLDGRETKSLRVVNRGDRPIQVGSHFHFSAANPALSFDRSAANGFRLAICAGTSVRFEPGVAIDVELVALAGRRHVPGLIWEQS